MNITRKKERKNTYRSGYVVELWARDKLEELGAELVVRSGRSKTPIDLIALFPDKKQIWLVQCKAKKEAPKDPTKLKTQFKDLTKLDGEYKVIPYAYMKKNGKYQFLRL